MIDHRSRGRRIGAIGRRRPMEHLDLDDMRRTAWGRDGKSVGLVGPDRGGVLGRERIQDRWLAADGHPSGRAVGQVWAIEDGSGHKVRGRDRHPRFPLPEGLRVDAARVDLAICETGSRDRTIGHQGKRSGRWGRWRDRVRVPCGGELEGVLPVDGEGPVRPGRAFRHRDRAAGRRGRRESWGDQDAAEQDHHDGGRREAAKRREPATTGR